MISDPSGGQPPRRAEDPVRTGGRLVVNTTVEGPHPVDESWQETECYASAIRHVDFESCLNTEDGAPTKQQCAKGGTGM